VVKQDLVDAGVPHVKKGLPEYPTLTLLSERSIEPNFCHEQSRRFLLRSGETVLTPSGSGQLLRVETLGSPQNDVPISYFEATPQETIISRLRLVLNGLDRSLVVEFGDALRKSLSALHNLAHHRSF
jgi:hypothetical protein